MKESRKDAIVGSSVAVILIAATLLALWFGWHKVGAGLLTITALLVGGLAQWLRSAMWRDNLKPRR